MTAIAKRCIVGGSGIGGLMAARVASEFFDEVILLDRDTIPESPNSRDGVPQGNHFHAILPGGLGIMSQFFPDLKSELLAAGALTCTVGRDFYSYWREGISYSLDRYNPNSFEGPQTFIQTRGLLEHVIRRNVEGLANVSTRYNTAMLDPLTVANRICGVRATADGRADDIECDLCIDATGKAPRSIPWLQKLGFGRPEENVIDTDFSYTSVFLKPQNWDAFDGIGFFVMRDPAGGFANRIGGVIKLEQGLWIAFLGGRFADYPPREMHEFAVWARSLHNPIVADLIATATPVSAPSSFRFPRSIRRLFGRMQAFPDGLLPFGDAILHFNPIYGQGMSSACRQALGLHRILKSRQEAGRGLAGLAPEFFAVAHEETRAPWLYAAMSDFAAPQTTGDFPNEEAEAISMMKFLQSIVRKDADALRTLVGVATLQLPLSAFTSEHWTKLRAEQPDGALSA
jgi:2-polyprenyl-6-methoxyphenol hydroxylase-like FAD-dependent oxidoreductase